MRIVANGGSTEEALLVAKTYLPIDPINVEPYDPVTLQNIIVTLVDPVEYETIPAIVSLKEAQAQIPKDKAYYKRFTLRELAYIYNYGEITHSYSHAVIQSATVNPLDYAGRISKFEEYQRRDTKFSSTQIGNIVPDYFTLTINDFANKVNNENFGNDKARYIMFKLGIYNYSQWHDLTGFVGKGAKFLPQVSENIGKVLGGVSSFIGNAVGDIAGGMFEGMLGKDWKKKIAIVVIVIVIVIIIALIGLYYGKSYIGAKAIKKAVG